MFSEFIWIAASGIMNDDFSMCLRGLKSTYVLPTYTLCSAIVH